MRKRGILNTIKNSLERRRLGELLVSKGVITPKELRRALRDQKQHGTALGQIFLEQAAISKNQLRWMLCKQAMLRTCAAAALFFVSFTVSQRTAQADIFDAGAGIQLVSAKADFARVSSYPALYGTQEKRSTNLKAFTKWTGMFSRFERQLARPASSKVVREWQENLKSFEGQGIKAMANFVNKEVNKKRYITDSRNWGKSDYWATPVEFIQKGGDCEDFAIMKYTALRSMGVPEDRMRLAIVQDLEKNIPHAVLVVYTEQGAYILDNQIKRMINAESGTRYKPIYSINRQAWWLHSAPKKTLIASAD